MARASFLGTGAATIGTGYGTESEIGASLREDLNPFFNVRAFGATGDGATDDTAAFNAALDAVAALDVPETSRGATIYVPPGTYKLTDTLSINRGIVLQGTSGSGWYGGSVLQPADGVTGLVVERFDTSADGGRGDWSVIRDLVIGAAAKTVAGADGIWMKARAKVENCWVTGFSRYGINIDSDTDTTNANNFYVGYCRIDTNGSSGLYTEGTDSNAGLVVGVDSAQNGGWGFHDDSFLGNTYVGCHTAQNGGDDSVATTLNGGINSSVTTITLTSAANFAASGTILIGTEKISYNAKSGNDLTGCVRGVEATTAASHSTAAAVTEIYGGYRTNYGGSNATCFVSCYTESGQGGPNFINTPATVLGGINMHSSQTAGDGATLTGSAAGLELRKGVQAILGDGSSADNYVWLARPGTSKLPFYISDATAGNYQFTVSGSTFGWRHAGSASLIPYELTGTGATEGAGHIRFPNGIHINSDANERWWTMGTAAPVAGTYARGDIVWNAEPTAGGTVGWICTTAGTPGTWKTFGTIAA